MPNRLFGKSVRLAASRFAPAGTASSLRLLSRTTESASAPKHFRAFLIPSTPPSALAVAPASGLASVCPSFVNTAETSKRKFFLPADRPLPSICLLRPPRAPRQFPLLRNQGPCPPMKFGRPPIFSEVVQCSCS